MTIDKKQGLNPPVYRLQIINRHSKPREQLRGRGVCQMTILLHKSYLVKVTKKGGQKYPKNLTTWFMNDPRYVFMSQLSQLSHCFTLIGVDRQKD